MRDLIRRLGRDRAGSVAVEFALIALVLVQMLFGTVELMRAINSWSSLQWVCDTATRFAMANGPAATGKTQSAAIADVQAKAAAVAAEVGLSGATFSTSAVTIGTTTQLVVSGTYPFQVTGSALVPIPAVTLRAQSTSPFP